MIPILAIMIGIGAGFLFMLLIARASEIYWQDETK
jgi:hypothetical protein